MKIALVMYYINNIGGICNHIEQLANGFKKLGHQVYLVQLCYQGRFLRKSYDYKKILESQEYEMSEFDIPVSQYRGWLSVPWVHKFPYYGSDNLNKIKDYLSSMDLIIWETSVPTKQQGNRGNMDWISLYDIPVKQIGMIHDGNFKKHYPWINVIKKHLVGLACVHPCAYNSAAEIDIPRSLIVNPQNIDNFNYGKDWNKRVDGFISIQTFKSWKHVEDIFRAIPYMHDYKKIMGGGGLGYSYMISNDKLNHNFTLLKKFDPDLPDELDNSGIKIFDYSTKFGMKWIGYINTRIRDIYLRELKLLIDPSWSKTYSKVGDHFNRVVVDAAMQGAIPIARNLGISDNLEGNGVLFKPNKNYLMIPYDATPKQFGQYVNDYVNLNQTLADEIRYNNYELCKIFDNKKIAQDFINLSNGKPCGIYNKIETGILSDEVKNKSDYMIENFFSRGN